MHQNTIGIGTYNAGTNDLKQSSPRQISTSIANLSQEIQMSVPTMKLITSEVIVTNEDPQISHGQKSKKLTRNYCRYVKTINGNM